MHNTYLLLESLVDRGLILLKDFTTISVTEDALILEGYQSTMAMRTYREMNGLSKTSVTDEGFVKFTSKQMFKGKDITVAIILTPRKMITG